MCTDGYMIVYACTLCVLFMIMSPLRPKAGQFSQPLFFFFPQNSGRMGKMEYSLFAYPLAVHFSVGSCPFFTFVFQFVGLFVHVRSLGSDFHDLLRSFFHVAG